MNTISIFNTKYHREIVFITLLLAFYLKVIVFLSEDTSSYTALKANEISTILFDITLLYAWFVLVREGKTKNKIIQVIFLIAFIALLILHFNWQFIISNIDISWNNENLFYVQFLFLLLFSCYYGSRVKNEDLDSHGLRYDYILLVLLVGCPLATYAALNFDYFVGYQIIAYFLFFIGLSLIAIHIVRFIERRYLSTRVMVPLVMTLFFVYYSMPMFSQAIKKTADTNIFFHLLILCICSIFIVFLYIKEKKVLLVLVALQLVVTVGSGIYSKQNNLLEADIDKNGNESLMVHMSGDLKEKPDIYLLIYDSYVGRKLLSRYGINNDVTMHFLKTKGFQLYEQAYSLSANSLRSMAKVLDMSSGKRRFHENRVLVAGKSTVNKILQKEGYKTHYLLSPYMILNQPMLGDYSYPAVDQSKSFGADMIWRGIARGEFKSNLVYSEYSHGTMVKEKRAIITRDTEYPKFLYSHSMYPGHSQNSGVCLSDEIKLYSKGLAKANMEIKEDTELILSSDRNSIIIIAGDHGPHLTGDCMNLYDYKNEDINALHLADRFGAFVAIKWPEGMGSADQDLTIIQDIFFLVFANLFENEEIINNKLSTKAIGWKGSSYEAISNNMVIIGKDKGKKLYEAIQEYPRLSD